MKYTDTCTCNSDFIIHENKPWFDDVCIDKRYNVYRFLNTYRDNKSDINRERVVTARSEYKSAIRKARYRYACLQTEKLNIASVNNAKEYWKLLKQGTDKPKANIHMSDFERYFKAINSPDSPFFIPDEDVVNFNNTYINGELQIMFSEFRCTNNRRRN